MHIDWTLVWSGGLAVAVGILLAGLVKYLCGMVAASKA